MQTNKWRFPHLERSCAKAWLFLSQKAGKELSLLAVPETVSLNSLWKGTSPACSGFGTSGGFSFLCNPRACLRSSHSFRQILFPPRNKEGNIDPNTAFLPTHVVKKVPEQGLRLPDLEAKSLSLGKHKAERHTQQQSELPLRAQPSFAGLSPALVSATWWDNNHKAASGF